MAIEISPSIAGGGGAIMLAGGGGLAALGGRQLQAATALDRFATPSRLLPALREFRTTLAATDEVLDGVQQAMRTARIPGQGLLLRIPLLGAAADDLERAARLGAAARELAKVDETLLVGSTRRLNQQAGRLLAAAEDDALRLGAAKATALSGGTKLLAGGGIAAAGALLIGAALFDVGGDAP